MRARWVSPLLVLSTAVAVAGEPKPIPVDIKALRGQLVVLQDAQGGTYVVLPVDGARMWYGSGKTLYEQVVSSRSANGETGGWSVATWAPTLHQGQPGQIVRKDDGTFQKWCGNEHESPLTAVTADKAKLVLDKMAFVSTAMTRRPHLLARDDSGVYYYVDMIREQYGGSGYRVFVGKKGAMKQLPLSDVASDTAGEVFATKTGDLRFVHTNEGSSVPSSAQWARGEKKTSLVVLDVEMNSFVIFKDLGIYPFIGTICDDI